MSSRILSLPLAKLRLDSGTQCRVETREDKATEYAELLLAGQELHGLGGREYPVVYHDGKCYWLAHGFHRYRAHQIAERKHLLCEVLEGTVRDAILHAVGANAANGLPRSNADKRRAVLVLLTDEEWSEWPNTTIAERTGTTEGYVRKLRRELAEPADSYYTTPSVVGNTPATAAIPAHLKPLWLTLSAEQRTALLDAEREINEPAAYQPPAPLADGELRRLALDHLGNARRYLRQMGEHAHGAIAAVERALGLVRGL